MVDGTSRTGEVFSPRILVIDDTRAIHRDFVKILASEHRGAGTQGVKRNPLAGEREDWDPLDFRIEGAAEGAEAVQLVRDSLPQQDRYSLAFVDMRMPPGWDGLETVRGLWAVDPDIQVVICSAHSYYDWDEVIRRLRYPDKLLILKKPLDAIEVLQCANALTQKWLSEQKVRSHLDMLEQTVRTRTQELERANELLVGEIRRREHIESELGLAQKLEAVGRLASGIAHEINTPVQYIGDSVFFLTEAFDEISRLLDAQSAALTGVDEAGAARENAQRVLASMDMAFLREEIPRAIARTTEGASRVTQIVRAMKEFAHPGVVEKNLADINRALETTLVIARNEYKYVASVETSFEDIPLVNCNVGELSQVFLNMIVNAAHALEDAGKDAASGQISLSTRRVDGYVEIGIGDNGCGIPKEVMDKIYDPFFTTKDVGRGSGQGLAIARSIVVEKHGGRISVESVVGQGTRFKLCLPVDENAKVSE